jgi:hypothetical protein
MRSEECHHAYVQFNYLEKFPSSPDFHTFPCHFRRTRNLPRVLTMELPLEQNLRKCTAHDDSISGVPWATSEGEPIALTTCMWRLRAGQPIGYETSSLKYFVYGHQNKWRLLRSSKEPENHRESRTCQCMQVILELITSMMIIACSTKFLHHEYFGAEFGKFFKP